MKKVKSPVVYCFTWQLFIAGTIAFSLLFVSLLLAYSFALGACIFIVSNLYFTVYSFRYSGARYSDWVLRSFKWGESGKLILSAMGFALVFNYVKPLSVGTLFIGYITMVILQWIISARVALGKHVSQVAKNS